MAYGQEPADELLALSEALDQLAAEDPKKAELVKLRYCTGMSVQEAADVLGISRATADRYWAYAKVWLYCAISGEGKPEIRGGFVAPVRRAAAIFRTVLQTG